MRRRVRRHDATIDRHLELRLPADRGMGWALKTLRLLLALLLLLAALAGYMFLLPYGPKAETFVDIPIGTGTPRIGALLEEHGVIRSRYGFDLLRLVKSGRLRAGEYRFDHPVAMTEVYARLERGDVYTRTLVIPPGYNIFDIAQAVEQAGLGSRDTFLAAERAHTELIRRRNPRAASLEGFLFPDTYRFSRHSTPEVMLSTMVKRWERAIEQLGPEAPTAPVYSQAAEHNGGAMDWKDVVTVASLIEKEVSEGQERALVAGVFVNRLRRGMPLQTDPAVIYAALLSGRYRGTVYASDLQFDSPYNTYRHAGLPPGPICNPGMASLRAALAPAKTDYLYFVSDSTGHSRFATTLEEQARNVKSYREAKAGR